MEQGLYDQTVTENCPHLPGLTSYPYRLMTLLTSRTAVAEDDYPAFQLDATIVAQQAQTSITASRIEKLTLQEVTDIRVKGVKCRKCGNEDAVQYGKQTRAADEPETIFTQCNKCGVSYRS